MIWKSEGEVGKNGGLLWDKLTDKVNKPDLPQQVMDEISSDFYEIKPRGAFLGNGVIIVSREELDSTLKYIFNGDHELTNNPDKSYNYWNKDPYVFYY